MTADEIVKLCWCGRPSHLDGNWCEGWCGLCGEDDCAGYEDGIFGEDS
jgi:hypothetical protein